jgi:periplasmic divalent cation tolerance protein
MDSMKVVLLFLTCANQSEADAITKVLLEKRLVACIKQVSVTSQFLWHNAIDSAHEILLIMETIATYFDTIEQEIKKVHSYKTFVLTAVAAHIISKNASQWIKEILLSSRSP